MRLRLFRGEHEVDRDATVCGKFDSALTIKIEIDDIEPDEAHEITEAVRAIVVGQIQILNGKRVRRS